MPDRGTYVLDTSALLALRGDESGADRVEALIAKGRRGRATLLVSFITRMELLYRIWREEGEYEARNAVRLVDSFGVRWVTCEPEILEVASSLKALGALSLADSWIGATAVTRKAILIHKDPEFVKFKEIQQEFVRR
jgi:predicted nucleic acid-binding protein